MLCISVLNELAHSSNHVAVDTEFPGVVATDFGNYADPLDREYGTTKANVNILRPMQIGFSFFRETGEHSSSSLLPPLVGIGRVCTIQFNLK